MRVLVLALVLAAAALVPLSTERVSLKIASKSFTESVILGEVMRMLAEDANTPASHLRQLGGTRLVYEALVRGEVDAYPEYTGTIAEELFAGEGLTGLDDIRAALAREGLSVSAPLGFNNTYALGMRAGRAAELGIESISDLGRHPDLRYGLTSEFLEREDGWRSLRQAYGLAPRSVTGLEHDLAYRQLDLDVIDVMDVYTTDARITSRGVRVLRDDREFFPRYDAVLVYRNDALEEYPQAMRSLLRLEGRLSEAQMIAMNSEVERRARTETEAAAHLARETLGVAVRSEEPGRRHRIVARTAEHLDLMRRSLLAAILVALPLAILGSRWRWLGQTVLAVTGIAQTIPALALLVLLMPLVAALGLGSVGTGSWTAIIALFLYSLLPIVRGAHSGLLSIPAAYRESAHALGLTPRARLLQVELPLASPAILAGIKTAAIQNVGFATLGALVGAGGYGQPILSGIRLADTDLILEGAVPAAAMALVVQLAFEGLERLLVPRGLRVRAAAE